MLKMNNLWDLWTRHNNIYEMKTIFILLLYLEKLGFYSNNISGFMGENVTIFMHKRVWKIKEEETHLENSEHSAQTLGSNALTEV